MTTGRLGCGTGEGERTLRTLHWQASPSQEKPTGMIVWWQHCLGLLWVSRRFYMDSFRIHNFPWRSWFQIQPIKRDLPQEPQAVARSVAISESGWVHARPLKGARFPEKRKRRRGGVRCATSTWPEPLLKKTRKLENFKGRSRKWVHSQRCCLHP